MKWYTVKEVAERLKVTEKTVAKWLRDGRFPHAKKNGKWRIPECCLDGHTQAGKPESVKPEEEVKPEPANKPDPELEKLQHEVERLKVEKEKKTLEADVAGIWNPADQAKIKEREDALSAREEAVLEREEAVMEREGQIDAKLGALKDKQVEWDRIMKDVHADLKAIHDYYSSVCAKWLVSEEVLLPDLILGEAFFSKPFSDILITEEDEIDEGGLEL